MRVLLSLLLASCAHEASVGEPRAGPTASPTLPSTSAEVTPRAAPLVENVSPESAALVFAPRVRELALEGFEPAVVVLPKDDSEKVRLAVVAHGAGGRPEPHCEHYRRLLGDRFVIACTRGRSMSPHLPEPERGYFYDGHPALGRELRALITALGSTAPFASVTKLDGAVYIGYSQGATMGILALHEDPEVAAHFSRILLVEGGSGDWTIALAKRMAARDVKVVIACGQKSCDDFAQRSRGYMTKAGLRVKTTYASGAGHTYGGEVEVGVVASLPWLLE